MEDLVMTPAIWDGRRVLVTGHTGFKGGWLTLWLHALGARVFGYALPAQDPGFYNAVSLAKKIDASTLADLRDLTVLKDAMRSAAPDVVFHLAAQPLVRQSYADPLETYTTNVIGTANLLEAVRATPSVRAVVVVTTDKCYENREWEWAYRENDPVGGHDPYSSSKACAELLVASWRASFLRAAGVAVATARAGNVLGGGDWAADRLLPDFLRSRDNRTALVIRSPQAIRPWQHVLEPLSGYLLLAQRLLQEGEAYAQAWNFGPRDDDARSVEWIIRRLQARCPDVQVRLETAEQPHEAFYLKLDISKARQRLGWTPRWRLDTALDRTLDWHCAWRDAQDMGSVSLKQIADYTATQAD